MFRYFFCLILKSKYLFFVLFFTQSVGSLAQNLIPNGSFEQTYKPLKSRYSGNIENAIPWFSAGIGSPDLINQGAYFYGFKQASQGVNYAGIILYDSDNKEFREYLSVKLINKLVKNKKYILSLKVASASQSFFYTDELGIKFTLDSLISRDWNTIKIIPDFKSQKFKAINDTIAWQSIKWEYTAIGNEQFITLGNFRDDINTNLQTSGIQSLIKLAYIYIDEINLEVIKTKEDSINSENLNKINLKEVPDSKEKLIIPNVITPNNDGFNDTFLIENLPYYSQLIIRNKKGIVVYQSNNYKNDWNGASLVTGNYPYELKLPDGNVIFGALDIVRK
jgi:gliding motility-associated-like protein